jgi:hypothetical protein
VLGRKKVRRLVLPHVPGGRWRLCSGSLRTHLPNLALPNCVRLLPCPQA